MFKAGFLGAIIGFVYITGLNILSPFCTLCVTPVLGVSVGYLANLFDKPLTISVSLGRAIVAGGITGGIVLFGQIVATVANGILLTNLEDWESISPQFGYEPITVTEYWQATFLTNSFCGLFNLVTIVGLAAVGGVYWFHKHQQPELNLNKT